MTLKGSQERADLVHRASEARSMSDDVFVADELGVIRCPAFSTSTLFEVFKSSRPQLASLVLSALQQREFRNALFIASKGLYERAMAWAAGDRRIDDLDVAVAKYLIRMASRPTPFGLFSSVGVFSTRGEEGDLRAPEPLEIRPNISLDYTALTWLVEDLLCERGGCGSRLLPNDTLVVHDSYISLLVRSPRGRMRALRVVEIERSDELDFAIQTASTRCGLTSNAIAEAVHGRFYPRYERAEVDDYISELVKQEILVADALTSPTLSEPLDELIDAASPNSRPSDVLLGVKCRLLAAKNAAETDPGSLISSLSELSSFVTGAGFDGAETIHADSAALNSLGSLDKQQTALIERVVSEIAEFSPRAGGLKIFKERFVEIYGDASVPLAELIPLLECLGYPDQIGSSAALADHILRAGPKKTRTNTAALNAWEMHAVSKMAQTGRLRYVDLTGFSPAVGGRTAAPPVPDCLVAWLAMWQGPGKDPILEIKSLGAQEPGRVMGRFAHAIPELHKYLERVEQPGGEQIAAQIVHVPVVGAGNIIARCALSGPEIKIRAGGKVSSGDIVVADLEVRVSGDMVHLWSRSLGKYVIPRMNSAHAFERAKGHGLYIFLNNVSNQGPVCRTPSLRGKIPSAEFLPGLAYKGVVLERPSWMIRIDTLFKGPWNQETALQNLREWAAAVGLPTLFEEFGRDSSIPYSLDQDWIALEFLKELKRRGTMILTEAFPGDLTPGISSTDGPRCHELQIALRNVQRRRARSLGKPHAHVNGHASAWLYWTVHAKPSAQNSIVVLLAKAASRASYSTQHKMFFVRYRDAMGDHLRIRFKAEGREERQLLAGALESDLGGLVRKGLISHFAQRVYVPELDRYGGREFLNRAEQVFCADSAIVMKTIGTISGALNEAWRSAAVGADSLLRALGLEEFEERMAFATRAAAEFQRELRFDLNQRKSIGEVFRASEPLFDVNGEYARNIQALSHLLETKEIGCLYDWSASAFGAWDQERIYRYRWSLVHMRFNRIFPRHSRLQEAACWELLKRSYMRVSKVAEC